MKWSLPTILAAILVILEVQFFTLFVENESMQNRIRSPIIVICIVISEVFVWFISIDISFSRPLPVVLEMLFEFIVSMFVLELSRTLAWGSLEILFYSTLPSFLDEVLCEGPHYVTEVSMGNDTLFTGFAYFVAIFLFYVSLYLNGVIDFPFVKIIDDIPPSVLDLECEIPYPNDCCSK